MVVPHQVLHAAFHFQVAIPDLSELCGLLLLVLLVSALAVQLQAAQQCLMLRPGPLIA